MKRLSEALLSTTKLSKDDTRLFLSDILDKIPELEYTITNKGNRNLITFKSAFIGFKGLKNRDKNSTIDGKLYNCDIFFSNPKHNEFFYCYFNLANLTAKNDNTVRDVLYCGSLDNVKIVAPFDVSLNSVFSVVHRVSITSNKAFYFAPRGYGLKYSIRDLQVSSKLIELYSWQPSMISDVVFSCNKFKISDSYRPWEALVQKMKSIKTKEQVKTMKGTIEQQLLKKMIEGCLDVEFKNFPKEIEFRDEKKRYEFTQQSDGDYTWEYIA